MNRFDKTTKIVVGAINPYDGHTLEKHLKQTGNLTENKPQIRIVDRGYRGKKSINSIKIISSSVQKKRIYTV